MSPYFVLYKYNINLICEIDIFLDLSMKGTSYGDDIGEFLFYTKTKYS